VFDGGGRGGPCGQREAPSRTEERERRRRERATAKKVGHGPRGRGRQSNTNWPEVFSSLFWVVSFENKGGGGGSASREKREQQGVSRHVDV